VKWLENFEMQPLGDLCLQYGVLSYQHGLGMLKKGFWYMLHKKIMFSLKGFKK
jgi:hypothetical protein